MSLNNSSTMELVGILNYQLKLAVFFKIFIFETDKFFELSIHSNFSL